MNGAAGLEAAGFTLTPEARERLGPTRWVNRDQFVSPDQLQSARPARAPGPSDDGDGVASSVAYHALSPGNSRDHGRTPYPSRNGDLCQGNDLRYNGIAPRFFPPLRGHSASSAALWPFPLLLPAAASHPVPSGQWPLQLRHRRLSHHRLTASAAPPPSAGLWPGDAPSRYAQSTSWTPGWPSEQQRRANANDRHVQPMTPPVSPTWLLSLSGEPTTPACFSTRGVLSGLDHPGRGGLDRPACRLHPNRRHPSPDGPTPGEHPNESRPTVPSRTGEGSTASGSS